MGNTGQVTGYVVIKLFITTADYQKHLNPITVTKTLIVK